MDSERTPNLWLTRQDVIMLNYAIIFLIIAIIAGVLGFGGIAGARSTMLKP